MENPPSNMPGERRPIASRERPLWKFLATKLAQAHISANLISILGMFAAFFAAAALVITPYVAPISARFLFFAAACGIQLRLIANMLDGMVAIQSGKVSPVGELYNEIPDRISDTFILAAAGYATLSDPALGWAAAATALFVTYLRAVGKTLNITGLFIGPMSKSHRMFTLTLGCLYLTVAPDFLQPNFTLAWPSHPMGLMAIILTIIILGGIITAGRRLARIVRALKDRH